MEEANTSPKVYEFDPIDVSVLKSYDKIGDFEEVDNIVNKLFGIDIDAKEEEETERVLKLFNERIERFKKELFNKPLEMVLYKQDRDGSCYPCEQRYVYMYHYGECNRALFMVSIHVDSSNYSFHISHDSIGAYPGCFYNEPIYYMKLRFTEITMEELNNIIVNAASSVLPMRIQKEESRKNEKPIDITVWAAKEKN